LFLETQASAPPADNETGVIATPRFVCDLICFLWYSGMNIVKESPDKCFFAKGVGSLGSRA
jgi:hypothetical protein